MDAVELSNWRNFEILRWDLGARFNVVSGPNGVGKSSLLEALGYLARLRSYRNATSGDLIRTGASRSSLKARLGGAGASTRLEVVLTRGAARRIALNGKRPVSRAAWVQSFPVVLFHPQHLELIGGKSEHRRNWLDQLLMGLSSRFAHAYASYQRALRSRNQLLRRGASDHALEPYDRLMATHCATVVELRASGVHALGFHLGEVFAELSESEWSLAMHYNSALGRSGALLDVLAVSRESDRRRGYTGCGPHLEDVEIVINGRGSRRQASQGQQRLGALALKLAELNLMQRALGKTPLLLLDDVSSELDKTRQQALFRFVSRLGGQVVVTTTRPELIELKGQVAALTLPQRQAAETRLG